MSTEQQLNEYLFVEFGIDVEESTRRPSASWPFELTRVGVIDAPDGQYTVFRFDAEEPHYVLDGPVVQFLPVSGMELSDVRCQLIGERWMASQQPIDLETSVIGDDSVPPIAERRRQIQALAESVPGTA